METDLSWVLGFRTEFLTAFFRSVTFFGDERFAMACIFLGYLVWDRKAFREIAIIGTLAVLICSLLKAGIAAPRPDIFHLENVGSGDMSFPSGHMTLAVTFWGMLALFVRRMWFWVLAISVMILVGASRLYLGVHFVRDVVAGLLLGFLCIGSYLVFIKRLYGPLFKENDERLCSLGLLIAGLSLGINVKYFYSNDAFSAAGALVGIIVAYKMDLRFVHFRVSGSLYVRGCMCVCALGFFIFISNLVSYLAPSSFSFLYLFFTYILYSMTFMFIVPGVFQWVRRRVRNLRLWSVFGLCKTGR